MTKMKDLKLKFIAILVSAIWFPLLLIISAIKKIFTNFLSSFVVSLIIWYILRVNFLNTFFTILLFLVAINLVFEYKLFRETIINQADGTYANLKFNKILQKYKKNGEKYRISPIISVDNKKYRVAEFGTYTFDPRDSKKITGFVIFDENENIVNNENLCNEIVNIYLFWRKIYFEPILGKVIKESRKNFIKNWIKFQEKFKASIEERIKNNYSKISSLKEKEYVEILKELDREVIDQYPFVTNKLKLSLEIFDKLYDIFLKPSRDFYYNVFDKIDKISRMGNEENIIWSKRLSTWERLTKFYEIKIERMPKANYKGLLLGLIGDLIDFFFLETKGYPVGSGTVLGLSVEGGKSAKKKVYKYINNTMAYHKFGIDAIKQQIETNKELIKVRNEYKNILLSNNTKIIRNLQ